MRRSIFLSPVAKIAVARALHDGFCWKTRTGFYFVTFSRDILFGWGLFFWRGAHLPDTALGCTSNHCASLSAYSLPRSLTHSVLSGCCGAGSTAHCSGAAVIRVAGRANGSGGYGRSACARATDALLAAKVSIAAMRIPTAAATTLSSSAFAATWMLCIAPTPANPQRRLLRRAARR